jgi:hypothetical protein
VGAGAAAPVLDSVVLVVGAPSVRSTGQGRRAGEGPPPGLRRCHRPDRLAARKKGGRVLVVTTPSTLVAAPAAIGGSPERGSLLTPKISRRRLGGIGWRRRRRNTLEIRGRRIEGAAARRWSTVEAAEDPASLPSSLRPPSRPRPAQIEACSRSRPS